jgi:hypothetical protein
MISTRKQAKIDGKKTYISGKPCPNGHVGGRRTDNGSCVECSVSRAKKYKSNNKEAIKKTRKIYENNNNVKIQIKDKEYRNRNKNKINEQRRKRDADNINEIREKSREYQKNNRVKIRESRREYSRLYMIEKRKDPVFKMKCVMRSMVRRLLIKTKTNRNSRTEYILGYSDLQLKHHIESMFVNGMSWVNRDEWHVDHIESIDSFLRNGVNDPKIINALSNLQPLWVIDNLRKGA